MSVRQLSVVSISFVFLLFFMSACETERTSGKGMVLPQGNIENGKAAFVSLGCIRCHSVAGVETPAYEGESKILLVLGGKVQKVMTYGELVTSITNPNHIISLAYLKNIPAGESAGEITTPMPSFNDEMTVAQLIDLVTFLDSNYENLLPDYTGYQYYGMH